MTDNLPPNFNSPPASQPASQPPVSPPPVSPSPPPPPTSPSMVVGVVEEKPRSNKKVIVASLALILVVASTAAAVYLAGQRQEVRKEAAGQLTCRKWSGGEYSQFPGWYDAEDRSNPTINKINYSGDVSQNIGWKHVYWCDYQKASNKAACRDSDSATFIKPKSSEAIYDASAGGFTPNLSELIVQDHSGGKCQIIQVDVTPCSANEPFYVIYANSECPETAPTPTPGGLTCNSLTSQPAGATRKPGESINLTCTGAGQGINHFEFRATIGSGGPTPIPSVAATGTTGQISYTIPEYGCYKIECRACTSADGSACTVWGKAQ